VRVRLQGERHGCVTEALADDLGLKRRPAAQPSRRSGVRRGVGFWGVPRQCSACGRCW
jgi:hypothetical protein